MGAGGQHAADWGVPDIDCSLAPFARVSGVLAASETHTRPLSTRAAMAKAGMELGPIADPKEDSDGDTESDIDPGRDNVEDDVDEAALMDEIEALLAEHAAAHPPPPPPDVDPEPVVVADPGVAPPPAPEPQAKAKAKAVVGPKYHKYDVFAPTGEHLGYLLKVDGSHSFDAHCALHGGDCSIGRTWIGWDGVGKMTARRAAKGRSLAFLVAWLRLALRLPADATREDHMGLRWCKGAGLAAELANGNSPLRQDARHYVETEALFAPLRAVERQPRAGEGIETAFFP